MITKSFPASFSVPLALALFVAAQCSIPAARAAGYLEFEGIPGEATAPGFENWIEIDSVEFGARGGGANPVFTHIVLSKRPDQASPLLFLASVLGSQREAKIRFTKLTSSGNRRVYLEPVPRLQLAFPQVLKSAKKRPKPRIYLALAHKRAL